MNVAPYVRIARPDNWFKNIFMLPGVVLALYFFEVEQGGMVGLRLIVALASTCLVASSN